MTITDTTPITNTRLLDQLAETTRRLLDRAKVRASTVTASGLWVHVTILDDTTLALAMAVIDPGRTGWTTHAVGRSVLGIRVMDGVAISVTAPPATCGSEIGVGDIVTLKPAMRRSPELRKLVGHIVRVRRVDPLSGHMVTVWDEYTECEWSCHERDLDLVSEGTAEDAMSSVDLCIICEDAYLTLGESDGRCTSCREQGLVPA